MSIKRYIADADNTITNAYKASLTIRGTGSNMGASDVLEVFSIYGQESSSSIETSRVLINFPISDIAADRTSGTIPISGAVNFRLNMYNAEHSETLPTSFTLNVAPLSRSWDEGTGLDMEEYTDIGASSWERSTHSTFWNDAGADMWPATSSFSLFSQSFDGGTENLEVDITGLVEEWLAGAKPRYGVAISLLGSQEDDNNSYYTKRLFARGSEFFFKRPSLEARWDSAVNDNRGNFYLSSSLASSADNKNTLYLYNYVRGQLKNIPSVGTGSIYVKLYTSSSGGDELTSNATPINPITGGWSDTGVYTASFGLTTTASLVYDRWLSGALVFHTGSFKTTTLDTSRINPNPTYYTTATNLRAEYFSNETARLRFFVRKKDWSPTIYTKAVAAIEGEYIEDAYYQIIRPHDGVKAIEYGTGSLNHTRLSYDVSGSYFDLDMSLLEKDYAYYVKLVYYINGKYNEQPETFKFRVE